MPDRVKFRRLFGANDKIFNFDPNLATMVTRMAKRATSVFAASPIIQGKMDSTGIGDIVSIDSFGTAIAPKFYQLMDMNQVSFVFWITPEWNGNDGLNHVILREQSTGCFYILKDNNNLLTFYWNGIFTSVDVSSWVAGVKHSVVLRADTKNTLDGTNYFCTSIDDSHSFGVTSVTTPNPLGSAAFGIWSTGSGNYAGNCIIEGFTIYRRPLFDGAYGKDIGNGDEINQIYAAGVGVDPTTITGSWDVCLCVPTNSTAGQLVTGTGEAWSHPHSSNLLTRGWLSDGYYGGGQWAVKFNGTNTRIDCGSDASLDDIPAGGGIIQVEAWVYFGANNGTIISKGTPNTSGWGLSLGGANDLNFFANSNGAMVLGTISYTVDNKWHHVLGHYNDTTKIARVALDGVWGNNSTAGAGVYNSDAGNNLFIGRYAATPYYYFTGSIGWINIHNDAHYTPGTNFVAPRTLPAADVEEWSLNDGSGATAAAVINAANNGTITNGTWEPQWYPEGTPVIPTSLQGSATCQINLGSGATIDDLMDGATTIEGWFRATKGFFQYLAYKGTPGVSGWYVRVNNVGQLDAAITCVTTSTGAVSTSNIGDNRWHHYALTFDDAGDRKARLYVDGKLEYTGVAGVGAIVSDAASVGLFGNSANGFLGALGWQRWSNSVRYTTNFILPSRVAPPAPDANTLGQWNMTEGAGTAVADSSGNGNNGTISGTYTWVNTPDMATCAPGARTYAWGVDVGSDAANDGIKQTLTGLSAGARYALRALCFQGRTGLSQPSITIYDETNSAIISTIKGQWQYEICQAGDMSDGTKWVQGTGWAIAAGVAHAAAADAWMYQLPANQLAGGIQPNHLYKVTYTVANLTGGSLYAYFGTGDQGTSRVSDGTYTEILKAGAAPTMIGFKGTGLTCDLDNVSVIPISNEDTPDVLMCSFELPTVARDGAAADCTSISVKLINEAGAGLVGWHQAELYTNLIDNPSLNGVVADPYVPYGWTNSTMVAGEASKETTDVHSSGTAVQTLASNNHCLFSNSINTFVIGKFYAQGGWMKKTSGTETLFCQNGNLVRQATAIDYSGLDCVATYWKHYGMVVRANNTIDGLSVGFGVGNALFDDLYYFALDDVSLTVTPANQANSTENGGLRVDGYDTLSQAIPAGMVTSTRGKIRFTWIPRHGQSTWVGFGNSTILIADIVGNAATDRLRLYSSAANTLTLSNTVAGVNQVGSVVLPVGTIVAGGIYAIEIGWNSNGSYFSINGMRWLDVLQSVYYTTVPATIYWGMRYASDDQCDAVFSAP